MGIRTFLDSIFSGDDGMDSAERVLAGSAGGVEQRSGPAPGPLSLLTHPFLKGLPDDYGGSGKTLRRPYEQSAWVMRAIKHVAEPIAGVPLRFATPTPDGAKQLVDGDLAAFWERPAIGPEGPLSRSDVVEATVGWLKLAGETFWVFDDGWLLPRGPRNPFVIVQPGQIRGVLSQDGGKLLGWWFRDASGREYALLPEQVVHPKFWNPYDPLRGSPEWLAAKVAAESDVYAGEFVRNLMQNNGDRGPIISSKGPPLTDAQIEQIKVMLKAKRDAAQRGDYKPAFLSGEVAVHDPQVSRPDADFVAQRIESRKEIYLAFGVPASLAEPKAHYSIGAASDRYVLIEDTCKPLAAKIASSIALVSMRLKGMPLSGKQHLIAYFDFEQHSVMLQARTERIDVAMKLWGIGMPFADVNAYLNLQAPKFDGDDQGFLPLAIQRVDEAKQPPPDDPTKPPGGTGDNLPEAEDNPTDKMLRVLRVPVPTALERALIGPVASPSPVVKTTPDDDETAREALWQRHMKLRRPAEKLCQRTIGRVLMQARSEVLRKLESTGKRAAAAGEIVQKDDDDDKLENQTPAPHPGSAIQVIFDPVNFTTELTSALDKVARVNMQTAGEQLRAELGIDDPWTMPPATALNALRDRENLLKGASNEVFEEIKGTLEEGFQVGETTAQLADRVRAKFNEISDGRAATIAVTETGSAYSAGRQASATAAGCKTKSWLSARDKKVRPTHRAADGQKVNADGVFAVGADRMSTPCNGSLAEENCNCRCVALFHAA